MRLSPIAFFLFLFVSSYSFGAKGCPGDEYLKLVSGRFDMCLPLEFYKNATLMNGGGIIAKLSDASGFSVQIFTPDMDSLPDSFDMRTYPGLMLGLMPPAGLTDQQSDAFKNSLSALRVEFGTNKPIKYMRDGKTFFYLSKNNNAIAYVTLNSASDQVLFFTFEKMDEKKIKLILNGVQ